MKNPKKLGMKAATIEYFTLEKLYISSLNPRKEADVDGIELLAESLASVGMIQPLAGHLDEDGRVGIVGGGRRLRAIKLALERHPDAAIRHPELAEIPVRTTTDLNVATAWASAENIVREALEPFDEIRAFAQMRDSGAILPDIARAFATTEAHVRRRMALADLPVEVLNALKAKQISLSAAAAFTVTQDRELAVIVLNNVLASGHWSERQIRTALMPDSVRHSDRRAIFVGIDAYEKAGGKLTRDLFSEDVTLHDVELLDNLFAEKLRSKAEDYAQGYKWFEVLDDTYVDYRQTEKLQRVYKVEGELTEEECARYDELGELYEAGALDEEGEAEVEALQKKMEGDYSDEQRQISGLFVYVTGNGDLSASGPWIKTEDQQKAVEAGVLTGHAAVAVTAKLRQSEAPAPRYSNSLLEDMQTLQLHAVQSALARDLDLQLDLLAFQLGKGGYGKIFDISPIEAKIVPEKADGLKADPILNGSERRDGWMNDEERAKAFEDFRAKGKDHRNEVLAVCLARLMPHSTSTLFANVAELAGADMRSIWTPTKADFFGRMKSDHLDDLMVELTGLDRNDTRIKTFCGQKKGGKAEGLEDLFTDPKVQALWGLDENGAKRLAEWLPDCL